MRRSIQRELNDFFGRINDSDYSIQHVTKSAFTQARSKLKSEAFSELSSTVANSFYRNAPYLLWGKHRILAADGSTIILPTSTDIAKVFEPIGFGPDASVKRSVAKISLVYDVLNLVTINAKIDGFKVHETTLLKTQVAEVAFMPNDILLLDRGYPDIGLLYELQHRSIGFCVRLKDNWWKEVNAMLQAKETSKIVTFRLPKKEHSLQETFKGKTDKVTVRLVVIELGDGKKEILCTSLIDPKKYTLDSLKQLYHFRWGIEEAYKLFKVRANLESFSGMSAISVKQDFHAAIFSMNICATMSFPIEQKVREESKEENLKNIKKVNKTNVLSMVCECMIGVFVKKRIKRFLNILDEILTKTTEAVRPNRSFPRNHKQKKPKPMSYKNL